MWNCLWRAGGSIIHGHAQVTATRDTHYPKVERLRRAAAAYKRQQGSDYFEDLATTHASLGLDIPLEGVHAFASLSPIKEKELVVVGSDPAAPALSRAVGALLQGYVHDLGVRAFNVAFYMPPLGPAEEEDWSDFPTVVFIVDRGNPANRTSDMGAMELYAASVVASDPFRVAEALRADLSG
jgi:galactose-1-phosphate uridylyltransferase